MSNLHIWYDNNYVYGENFEENIIYILWTDNNGEAIIGNYSEYYYKYAGFPVNNQYDYYITPNDIIDIYKLQNTDEAVHDFITDGIESEELIYIGSLTFDNNFEYYATPITSNVGNKTISSLIIHNKEVASIVTSDNVVLYEKEISPNIELTFVGATLTQYRPDTLVGDNIKIDYGDGTVVDYNGDYSHTYTTSGTYTISIYGVTSLANFCFRECDNITEAHIIKNISSMGTGCFRNCIELTTLTIDDGNAVGTSMCYNCRNLTEVTLPNDLTTVTNYMFYNCKLLTTLTIPNSVTSFGNNCFNGCSSLTALTIPNSVTSIEDYCFQACSALTNIVIPNGVPALKTSCFYNCKSLTSVTIPNSVTSIDNNCFRGDTSLIDYQLYWDNPPVTWTNNMMPNNTNTYYTIPYGSTANYTAKSFPSAKLQERNI